MHKLWHWNWFPADMPRAMESVPSGYAHVDREGIARAERRLFCQLGALVIAVAVALFAALRVWPP